jgi:predicted aspartyl protease
MLAAVVAGIAMASGMAAGESACRLVRVAEWPVRLERNQLLVDGAINRKPLGVKLDTGTTRTILLRQAAVQLGLPLQRTRGRMYGIGGEADLERAFVDEFIIGETTRENWRMLVAGRQERGDGVAVLLGEDFLHKFDVEFDLAHNRVRLYQPEHCDDTSLAYWAAEGVSVVEIDPVDEGRPQIVLTVRVNGQPVRALLDSGAESSLLTKNDAATAGITPETNGVVAIGKVGGLGRKAVAAWVGPFKSVAIGKELFTDTALPFADLYKDATYTPVGSLVPRRMETLQPMLLGVDFLRAHRVLVSHSQRRIYFTYGGGPAFMWAGALPNNPVPTGDARP